MNLRHIAVAAALAVSAVSALAVPVTTFDHDFGSVAPSTSETLTSHDSFAGDAVINYTFSLGSIGSLVGAYWTEPVFSGLNESFVPQFTLTAIDGNPALNGSTFGIEFFGSGKFGYSNLAAGSYTLTLNSFSAPYDATGTFGSTVTVLAAPVPEPETYAMMLAGLGAIGFMARRRKA